MSIACAHCGKATSASAKRCVHCGRVAKRAVYQARGEVRCPRCEAATEVVYLGPLEIDRCCACRGIWLDRGELAQLKELADDQGLRDGVRAALGDDARKPTTNRAASLYIGCPVCASPMSRRNYVDVSGIIIDRCEAHGTWLDQDDAIRLFELVVSGDETRLRKMGQQRDEREIDARLRRIEGEQMHQAHQLRRHDRAIWASIIWDIFD